MKATNLAVALVSVLWTGLLAGEEGADPRWLLRDPGDLRYDGVVFLLPYDGKRPPADCEVHLVPERDLENEQVFPCLEWSHPPAYGHLLRGWYEGKSSMSPYPTRFGAGQGSAMSVATAPLAPAGRVVLPGYPGAPGVVLRLLDAEPGDRYGRFPPDVYRSVKPEDWRRGALMPEGAAIGWLWDLAEERVLALSRPFDLPAGTTRSVPLSVPSGGGHLMAKLGRYRPAIDAEEDTTVLLRGAGGKRPPDFLLPTEGVVFAFWYDLPPGSLVVEATSPSSLLPAQELLLEPGAIPYLKADMLPRPTLELQLELPPELDRDRLEVVVARVDDGEEAARRKWDLGQRRDLIGGLPAALLRLEVATSRGAYVELFDLRPAKDVRLELAPRLTAITCRVGPAAAASPPAGKTTWRLFRGRAEGTGIWQPAGEPAAAAETATLRPSG